MRDLEERKSHANIRSVPQNLQGITRKKYKDKK